MILLTYFILIILNFSDILLYYYCILITTNTYNMNILHDPSDFKVLDFYHYPTTVVNRIVELYKNNKNVLNSIFSIYTSF